MLMHELFFNCFALCFFSAARAIAYERERETELRSKRETTAASYTEEGRNNISPARNQPNRDSIGSTSSDESGPHLTTESAAIEDPKSTIFTRTLPFPETLKSSTRIETSPRPHDPRDPRTLQKRTNQLEGTPAANITGRPGRLQIIDESVEPTSPTTANNTTTTTTNSPSPPSSTPPRNTTLPKDKTP